MTHKIAGGGRYGVILADPPWQYRAWTSAKAHGIAEDHYRTMTVASICALPVSALAASNCALFLWVTPPFLAHGLEVMQAWGFTYKTFGFTWVKTTRDGSRPAFGMGYYTRANAEPCLLGVKGKMPPRDRGVPQVVMSPRREHSRKPEAVHDGIARLYPHARKLELFARRQVRGWDCWGDEVTATAELSTL